MRSFVASLIVNLVATVFLASLALKMPPPQPALSVTPIGFLVSEVKITSTPTSASRRSHDQEAGTYVSIQHGLLMPGESTGWHAYAGPVYVTIAAGTLTVYHGDDPTCTPVRYGPGEGFVFSGHGSAYVARNQSSFLAADFYTTYLQPDSGSPFTAVGPPGSCPADVE